MFVDIAALFINVLFYGKFPNELILGTKPVERLVLTGNFATVLILSASFLANSL